MPKVYIVGGDFSIERMFNARGWNISGNPFEADLIQFTGGADVSPSLYGEEARKETRTNPKRDEYESDVFRTFKGKKPMAGICRGGQFLNVMCGGKMRQHVSNHTRYHYAMEVRNGNTVFVSSTHHQMIIPEDKGEVLLIANQESQELTDDGWQDIELEVEAVSYGDILCFQPHPEYFDMADDCQELYFRYLKEIV